MNSARRSPFRYNCNQLHHFIANRWLLVSMIIVFSCTNEEELVAPHQNDEPPKQPSSYEGVDESLWTYFDRFELEASSRGITIDLRAEQVTGAVSEIDARNVAGQCNYSRRSPNKVTVDLGFWQRSGDRGREFVVFHELGHCILYREHREDADGFNVCKSIMRSGTGDCIDNYNPQTRSGYLDELFDLQYQGDLFMASQSF